MNVHNYDSYMKQAMPIKKTAAYMITAVSPQILIGFLFLPIQRQ
ncbi:hypothetical protein ACUXCC_000465 [Cytobacillus horneckiae]